jgi:hypothetical protein
MADIDVVRKRSNAWVWIIALIAMALVIWALLAAFATNTNEPGTVGRLRPTVSTLALGVPILHPAA